MKQDPDDHKMHPATRILAAIILLGSIAAATCYHLGCSQEHGNPARGGATAPNIVLITLDTTRADHLELYGYFRDTMPALTRLAAESVVFDRLIVPMATTLPTHLSILTAVHPLEHGVLANSTYGGRRFVPSPKLRSFATMSREAGYATGGFVSAAPLKSNSGVAAGFDTFDEPELKHRDGGETTTAALNWLSAQNEGAFFLWVHYYDAHYPYEPPEAFRSLYQTDQGLKRYIAEREISPVAFRPRVKAVEKAEALTNLYDAELRFVDTQIARLIRALRARKDWDNTSIVIMGDHGEGLCQHGLAAHGTTWNEQLHAPLLMRVPGVAPRRVSTLISALDALPTLMGLIDAPQLKELKTQATGKDVFAAEYRPRPILSRDTGRDHGEGAPIRHALMHGDWKIFQLHHGDGRVTEELYNLAEDPYELRDLARQLPDKTKELGALLQSTSDTLAHRGEVMRAGVEAETLPEDAEVLRQLRELGYLVDGLEAETGPGDSDRHSRSDETP